MEGELCDRCKPGTIYLARENPRGCQPCFCFGLSGECEEREWRTAATSAGADAGWNLTDAYARLQVPHRGDATVSQLVFDSAIASGDRDRSAATSGGNRDRAAMSGGDSARVQPTVDPRQLYYWQAPIAFLGNRLTSYGANLHYFVYFTPSANGHGAPTPLADVVLEGGDNARLEFYSRTAFFPRENISVTVTLTADSGAWLSADTRRPADRATLMRALADVKRLLIRARYHQDQQQSR